MDITRWASALSAPGMRDALSGYRNVLAVVAALTFVQSATAALLVLVALTLKGAGASSLAIGVVASAYSCGFIVGALLSPWEIARIGHIRAYALFAAVGAIIALAFTLRIDSGFWAVAQAAMGACTAALYTAGESWVANSAPVRRRGVILGFYHLISKAGNIAGPFAVAAAEPGVAGFMVVAALFAASVVPVTATSRAQPSLSSAEPFPLTGLWRRAPAAVIAAFIAGVVNNSVAQLYPVYVTAVSDIGPAASSARFYAALQIGAMVALMPAGWLSDRLDRRIVIAMLGAVGSLAATGLLLAGLNGHTQYIWLLAAIYGAGSFSFYGVAVAHGADRSRPEETTSVMAGILMIWGAGAVIGPVVAGYVMSLRAGGAGLFLFAAIGLALLTILTSSRAILTRPVPPEEKEPFNVAPATTFAVAEIDPRGENAQLDLFTDSERAA